MATNNNTKRSGLTGANLKDQLWNTLIMLKAKKISPTVANSVATQSREIMRVVNTEIKMATIGGNKPTTKMLSFTE